jgi:hypothetical protein
VPNNWANCFWVFPKCCRIQENSLLSIQTLIRFCQWHFREKPSHTQIRKD